MGKKIIYLIFFICLSVIAQACSNADLTEEPVFVVEDQSGLDVISFEIYFEEQAYNSQGDIPVGMRFTNQGSKTVMVNGNVELIYPNSGEDVTIVFIIQDPSGEILPFGVLPHIIRDEPHYFPILEPGEETILLAKLNGYYNFTKPGKYTIQAIYYNTLDHPDGRPAWKGTVESNTVTIEITP